MLQLGSGGRTSTVSSLLNYNTGIQQHVHHWVDPTPSGPPRARTPRATFILRRLLSERVVGSSPHKGRLARDRHLVGVRRQTDLIVFHRCAGVPVPTENAGFILGLIFLFFHFKVKS